MSKASARLGTAGLVGLVAVNVVLVAMALRSNDASSIAASPSSTPPVTSCPSGQWLAQYYTGTSLSGAPAGVRCDAQINNTWGSGGPTGVGVGTDNFSVRWSQTLSVPAAGPYVVSTTSDDGIRVSVDGSAVIDNWTDHGPTTNTVSVALSAGDHTVVVEYYEHTGAATAIVSLTPPVASCPSGQWLAAYYTGTSLSGSPAGVRCDAQIDNTWGSGGPTGVGVGKDNFSVRWSQTLSVPAAGPYVVSTTSDDGIRVSVDGSAVIDNWADHGSTTNTVSVTLSAGDHAVVVEYYEHTGAATAQFTMTAS